MPVWKTTSPPAATGAPMRVRSQVVQFVKRPLPTRVPRQTLREEGVERLDPDGFLMSLWRRPCS